MVRINLIKPVYLTDEHLRAEYNEILMAVGYYQNHPKLDGSEPKEYVLGKGHIKFFKDKLLYLSQRFTSLKEEMIKRGFTADKVFPVWTVNLPYEYWKKYTPSSNDIKLVVDRIIDRIKKPLKKKTPYHYYGNIINIDNFCKKLKEVK